jgi:hypothetical protein
LLDFDARPGVRFFATRMPGIDDFAAIERYIGGNEVIADASACGQAHFDQSVGF